MRRIVMAALLATVSLSAQANDSEGWHTGAAVTFSTFSGKDSNPIKDSTGGIKAYAQYQFNRYLGFEGAYFTTGRFSGDLQDGDPGCSIPSDSQQVRCTERLRLHGMMGSFVGYVPWISSDDLKFYGKVGYYDFNETLSVDAATTSSSSDDGLTLGAGGILKISEHFDARLDADWFRPKVGTLWSVNLGIQYNFGGRHRHESAGPSAPPSPAAAPAMDAPVEAPSAATDKAE